MKAKKMLIKNLTIAFIGVSTFLVNETASASNSDNIRDTGIHIIYAGKDINFSVFRLIVNRQQVATYQVTIKDKKGKTLFTERLKGDSVSRTYKFPYDFDGGITGTSIEVKNIQNAEAEIYKISAVSKIEDEVSISKL